MIGEQFITTSSYADSQVDVDRVVSMHISTDAPVYVQIARINPRDGSRHWESTDTPFPAADFTLDRIAGVRFKSNGDTPANVFVIWTFHVDDAIIRRISTNGPFTDVDNFVITFNGRTGVVAPGNADYLAVASGGLPGAAAPTRYVGGTASGAPASGTFLQGDFVITQTGHVFVCTVFGTPGTWVDAGSLGNLVTSVFGRVGAVTAATNDYTAAQVQNAADKASAAIQEFTSSYRSKDPVNPQGYDTGSGGTVSQNTSRTTAVHLDKTNGEIVTFNSTLATGNAVVFTVQNSTVTAKDAILLSLQNSFAAGTLTYFVQNVQNGSFDIMYVNNGGSSINVSLTFNFAVFSVVTA